MTDNSNSDIPIDDDKSDGCIDGISSPPRPPPLRTQSRQPSGGIASSSFHQRNDINNNSNIPPLHDFPYPPPHHHHHHHRPEEFVFPPPAPIPISRERSRDEVWMAEFFALPMEAPTTTEDQQHPPQLNYCFDDDDEDDFIGDNSTSQRTDIQRQQQQQQQQQQQHKDDGRNDFFENDTSESGNVGVLFTGSGHVGIVVRSQEEVQLRFTSIIKSTNKIYRKSITSYIRRAKFGERIVTIIDGKPETRYEVSDDTSYVVCGMVANEYYVITQEEFQSNYDTTSGKPIIAFSSSSSLSSPAAAAATQATSNPGNSGSKGSVSNVSDGGGSGGDNNNDDNNKSTTKRKQPFHVTEYQARRFRRAGFLEYRSKRHSYAYEVTLEDIQWFQDTGLPSGSSSKKATANNNNNNNNNNTKKRITIKGESETSVASFIAPWGEEMRIEVGDYLLMKHPYQQSDGGIYRIGRDIFMQSYIENSIDGHYKDLAIIFDIASSSSSLSSSNTHPQQQQKQQHDSDAGIGGGRLLSSAIGSVTTAKGSSSSTHPPPPSSNNNSSGIENKNNNNKNLSDTWNTVRGMLQNRSKEEMKELATVTTSRNRTALHIAIEYGAPYDVIEKLFFANPNVLSDAELQRFVSRHRNKQLQRNAFHLACLHNAPYDVIELICKKLPDAASIMDSCDWLPLHFACKAQHLNESTIEVLKNSYPAALTTKNKNGATPLLLVMDHIQTNIDVIYLLTTSEVARIADPKGRLPLHLAVVRGLSEEILDHLFLFHPEAISHKDDLGRTPFECAIENAGYWNSKIGLATIKFLADEYPLVLSETNSKGATPLMQAIDEYEICDTEIISSLLTKEAARLPDNEGCLPLHSACIKGSPKEILELLILVYPEANSHQDNNGRRPFERALENVGNNLDGPAVIRFLLETDKNLVNVKCSNGSHPLEFLLDSIKSYGSVRVRSKDNTAKSRYCEAFKCILEADPDDDLGFFAALETLPQFLKEDAFQLTLESESLSQRRKVLQLDLFFSTFNPKLYRALMMRGLESDNSKDCLDWMNRRSCERSLVFWMMMHLYAHCAWLVLFIEASARYLTYERQPKNFKSFAIPLIPLACLFICLEASQFRSFWRTGVVRSYLTDIWNYLDVLTICLVLASAAQLIRTYNHLMMTDDNEIVAKDLGKLRYLLLFTGLFVFLSLVSFLKKLFLPFAIFVSGVLKIFVKLVPFGVLAALSLAVFSFMFFVERHDCPVDEDDEFLYNTLWNSFLSTFSSFVGDPPTARNWLDIFFGVVMIIVLLNVVIAIVNQEWDDATKNASSAFWVYRLDFLQKISREHKSNAKGDERQLLSQQLYVDKDADVSLYNLGLDNAENSEELPFFFAAVSMRIPADKMDEFKANWEEDSAALWSYVLHRLIYVFWFLAGLVSFGLCWPTVIRRHIFGSYEKKSNKKILLDEVDTVDKNILELESKMNSLTEKLDLLLEQVAKLSESK